MQVIFGTHTKHGKIENIFQWGDRWAVWETSPADGDRENEDEQGQLWIGDREVYSTSNGAYNCSFSQLDGRLFVESYEERAIKDEDDHENSYGYVWRQIDPGPVKILKKGPFSNHPDLKNATVHARKWEVPDENELPNNNSPVVMRYDTPISYDDRHVVISGVRTVATLNLILGPRLTNDHLPKKSKRIKVGNRSLPAHSDKVVIVTRPNAVRVLKLPISKFQLPIRHIRISQDGLTVAVASNKEAYLLDLDE